MLYNVISKITFLLYASVKFVSHSFVLEKKPYIPYVSKLLIFDIKCG